MSTPSATITKQGEISVAQDETSKLWRWEFFPYIGGCHISPSESDYEHAWPDDALEAGIKQVLEWFPEDEGDLQRWN